MTLIPAARAVATTDRPAVDSDTSLPPAAAFQHSDLAPPAHAPSVARLWGAVYLTLLALQSLLLAWGAWRGISAGWLPVPARLLDLRCAPWIVLHCVALVATVAVAAIAGHALPRGDRGLVWSRGALAVAALVPVLVAPWMVTGLLIGVLGRLGVLPTRAGDISGSEEEGPYSAAEPPIARSLRWRPAGIALLLCAAALLSAALIWPAPWRVVLPDAGRNVIDWLAGPGAWLMWLSAVVGLGFLLTAALGWYWEVLQEGGPAAWLTPVAVLAPWLVFVSAAILTGLGRDVDADRGRPVMTALVEMGLFWGVVSLYGVYVLIVTWPALRPCLATALVGYALWGPAFLSGWATARMGTHRVESARRLEVIAAGLRQYVDLHQALPPAIVRSPDGAPLYSWRVLLLPMLGEEQLYAKFDLSQPWDAPHNRALLAARPDVYRCGEFPWDDRESTLLFAPVGPETLFPPDRAVERHELGPVARSRIAVVEVGSDHRAAWTAPVDWDLDRAGADGFGSPHGEAPLVVNLEGDVRSLRRTAEQPGDAFRSRLPFQRSDAP